MAPARPSRRIRSAPLVAAPVMALAMAIGSGAPGATAAPRSTGAATPQLSTTTRLDDRRALVVGDRFYAMGTAAGRYPATGFHTRGEMGGFWTPPIKLLDGVWFGLGDEWFGPASRFTSGWGYTRTDLPALDGVAATRTDVVPDGLRAGLIGLTLTAGDARTVTLRMDAHSELMSVYPWGETTPSQSAVNLPDRGAYRDGRLVFRDAGTPPGDNQTRHDYTAVVGSTLTPTGHALGPDHRGPQDPAVICPASGPDAPQQPPRCDDTAYGRGTGGRLSYRVPLRAGRATTIWFAVAGSDRCPAEARRQQAAALVDPERLLATKIAARRAIAANSAVELPGDRLLQRSVDWSKQNLADSVQESRDLQVRVTNAGTQFPGPGRDGGEGPLARRGLAGLPVDVRHRRRVHRVRRGRRRAVRRRSKAHLRDLRDVSEIVNARSGKVVHEVTPDGRVYFGANADAGNTDETAKFPSAVALVWRWTGDDAFRDEMYDFTVRNMRYICRELDADGDGWPEGLGNVERAGHGRGEARQHRLHDPRPARPRRHGRRQGRPRHGRWASRRGRRLERRVRGRLVVRPRRRTSTPTRWTPATAERQHEDVPAALDRGHPDGRAAGAARSRRPGRWPATRMAPPRSAKREGACYTGRVRAVPHRHRADLRPAGNPGPTCDRRSPPSVASGTSSR